MFKVGDKVINTRRGGLIKGAKGTVTGINGREVTVRWNLSKEYDFLNYRDSKYYMPEHMEWISHLDKPEKGVSILTTDSIYV